MPESIMQPPERPLLRYGLAADTHGDDDFSLRDNLRIGGTVVLSPLALEVVERFDGESTIAEIADALKAEFPEVEVTAEDVGTLAALLDEAMLLDSPRLRVHLDVPVRKPACIGSYSDDPAKLREQLTALFTATGGPGLPDAALPDDAKSNHTGVLRAILTPHMDYGRGGVTYGHAFKELVENTEARVFVIIGTSHYSPSRFSLSRQHFDTPLGLVKTDLEYVNRIASHFGDGLFDDITAHVPEHAIELEVVLLQFLLAGRRPFKIVPLLTGSIQDCMRGGVKPETVPEIERIVQALRLAEAACGEPVCYVISGDLAHIGPRFGDKRKAAGKCLKDSAAADAKILATLETAQPGAFFDVIAAEKNARRICGLSPAWLTLEATRPRTGKVLHYGQFADPKGTESVSFAAMAFYG